MDGHRGGARGARHVRGPPRVFRSDEGPQARRGEDPPRDRDRREQRPEARRPGVRQARGSVRERPAHRAPLVPLQGRHARVHGAALRHRPRDPQRPPHRLERDAGPVLRASRARRGHGPPDAQDHGHPSEGGRRLRRQVRPVQLRDGDGAPGDEDGPSSEAPLRPRGVVHQRTRTSPDRDRHGARVRPRRRYQSARHPGGHRRGRVRVVRHHLDVLQRRAFDGPVQSAGLLLQGAARVHEPLPQRRDARPRRGELAMRPRSADGRGGRVAAHGSARPATAEPDATVLVRDQ